jgi:AraC-like DNA-binding protein
MPAGHAQAMLAYPIKLHNPPILWIDGRGSGMREVGFTTNWREIPFHLIEFASGGTWTLEIAGEPSREVPPGRVLVVPAGTRHRLRVVSGPALSSSWLFLTVVAPMGNNAFSGLGLPRMLTPNDSAAIIKLATPVIESQRTPDVPTLIRDQAAAFAIVDRLFAIAIPALDGKADARMDPVLSWIEANLHRHVAVHEIAHVADLSPSRLHDLFTKATGHSPIDWTIRARVRRAQRLLLAEPRPGLEEVASRCGFATSYYLCRIFRKVIGTTPLTWRESIRR